MWMHLQPTVLFFIDEDDDLIYMQQIFSEEVAQLAE